MKNILKYMEEETLGVPTGKISNLRTGSNLVATTSQNTFIVSATFCDGTKQYFTVNGKAPSDNKGIFDLAECLIENNQIGNK